MQTKTLQVETMEKDYDSMILGFAAFCECCEKAGYTVSYAELIPDGGEPFTISAGEVDKKV